MGEAKRDIGIWIVAGEGVHRSPRLLRERVLQVAGSEIAAAVTRSHPANRRVAGSVGRHGKSNKNSQPTPN